MTTQTLTMPPCSIESEEATLGSMLVFQDAIIAARSVVSSDDFYTIKNRLVFDAICHVHSERLSVDVLTVGRELERRGQLMEVGGASYLSMLLNNTPSALNVETYARDVSDTARRRRMIEAAGEIARLAYDEKGRIDDQISAARAALSKIEVQDSGTRDIAQVASDVYDQLVDWHERPLKPGQVRGVSCGLRSIDLMLGGFEPKKLYVLAARPAMGKSSLAFQIAFDIAKQGKRVLIFSIEMSADEVMQRWISRLIRVPFDDLKRGNIPTEKWEDITRSYALISEMKIVINDSARMTLGKIESEISKYSDIDLVVLDHLGLMADPILKGENESHRLGRLTWGFKQFSKIYHVPFMAVCQLNRGVEGRKDKRPMLSDLRESGDIEQNADVVLMLYRDDYYEQDSKRKGICEVIPRKVRSGDSNCFSELYFEKSLTEFGEIAK